MQRSSRLSSVCLSCIRSRKLCEIGAKFCHLHWKSGVAEHEYDVRFCTEVAKYLKVAPNPKIGQNGSLDN